MRTGDWSLSGYPTVQWNSQAGSSLFQNGFDSEGFIGAKSCSWHRLCKLFSMLYSERCHIWQRQQSSMNLLLFSTEHQNPGHQKLIQHTLPCYCVESSAILTSTNLWGDAVQFFWQKMLNGTHLEAKAVGLCGARGTMACSGPGDKLQPSNAIDLQLQLLKGCTPRLLPNNNLPFGSGAFRVCRTSQKCQITDVVKHSQNQSYVLGVKLLHLFIWDNCLSQGDQDAVLSKFQIGHAAN